MNREVWDTNGIEDAAELLRRTTRLFPPPTGRRHCLMLTEDGRLMLAFATEAEVLPLHFDPEDTDKTLEQLLAEIEDVVSTASRTNM